MTFDDVNTNRFEVGGTGKDSVPRIGKRPRQPYAGGVYRPLTNGSNTEKSSKEADAARTVPSDFAGHHGTRLFVAKDSIHHESPSTHGSIHTGAHSNAVRRVNESAETAHRAAEIMVPIAAAETTPTGSASASPSTEPSDTGSSSATSASAIAADVLRQTAAGVKTVGRAARQAAVSTKNAAAKAREAWHTFTNLKGVQFVIAFFRKAHAVWKKRIKFSYTLYTVIFLLLTTAETLFMKWIITEEPTYAAGTKISRHRKLAQGAVGQLTEYVTNMWLTDHQHLFILNFVGLALIYLALIFVINRFWIATLIFGSAITAFGVANKIKITVRSEPIIPADFSFISGGNTGNIMSFVPEDSQTFVNGAITVVTWFIIICFALFILDGRRCFIHCSWRNPFASIKNISGNILRIIAAILSIVLLISFTWNLSIPSSAVYKWAQRQGYEPQLFSPIADAQANGPSTTFLSLVNVKIMDKPESYSKATMNEVAARYQKAAKEINKKRVNRLTDNTVIMILSESFSDPLRAPRVSYSIDPMPNIRTLKNQTTSGLMLSPGYGGGTANIEYQEITGLNLANFSDSLTVPYQQLVPNQKAPYAFNQIWTERYGKQSAQAVHPYAQNMYLRHTNYKKFGFEHLYTDDSDPRAPYTERIDNSPYIDDSSAYQDIVDLIGKKKQSTPQFLQLITMQNHTPYNDWYSNNEFKEANTSTDLSGWERNNIDTFTKGVSYTDQATIDFLNKLNEIDKPITVIFYGDHLPGIYPNSFNDKNNELPLHETDYFIWSNDASASHNTKLDSSVSAYTSSNYFMALAAEHMNAKVTPYLAMLTELYQNVPAMSRLSSTSNWTAKGSTTYLDSNGNVLDPSSFSKKTKRLLRDYKLVQYDMTAGKNYLSSTNFTKE